MSYRTLAIGAVVFWGAASGCNLGSHGYDSYCSDGYCGDPYPTGYDDGYAGTGSGMPAGAGGGTAGGWSGAGGGGMYCEADVDCGPNMVCSPLDGCEAIVADCPLTPECIGDPEGYTPEWQGWDPLYAGSMIGGDRRAIVDAHLDFYETHLYGDAVLLFPNEYYDVVQVIVTGTRQGDKIYGQLIEVSGFRTFDAVYEATMPSASEMVGTVTIASDLGEWVAEMHLYRTSPCGCAVNPTGCTQSSDCPQGNVCLDAACVQLCASDQDCMDSSLQCVDFVCQPPEVPSPCAPPCADGAVCVEGACLTSCSHSCDCSSGEVCSDGVCTPAPASLLPRACETDCDCAYADGEVCANGFCVG